MSTKFNIELPFFPGFYETDLENSDTAYWAIKDELDYYRNECDTPCKELTEDDLEFDYSAYENEVAENFMLVWKDHAPDIVLSISDFSIDSPKYYNFRNDRLYVDIELREDWQDVMRNFIASNYDWLQERIHDDWTSYDGFMSFMDNDVDEWASHLFEEQDERYISTMLAYMMYRENKEIRNDLIMCALDDVYAGSYVKLTEEGKTKVAEAKVEYEKKHDPNQLEIPFEW